MNPPTCQFLLRVIKGQCDPSVLTAQSPATIVIGRAEECDVTVVSDSEVSRHHAKIEIFGSRVHLLDLGSANGSFVDGIQSDQAFLEHEQVIQVGLTSFRIEITHVGSDSDNTDQEQLETFAFDPEKRDSSSFEVGSVTPGSYKSNDAEHSPTQSKIEFERLGDYRLLEELGVGGMGQVYKAVHEPTEKIVAIKLLKQVPGQTQEWADLFAREAKILRNLQHERIVRFIEFGEDAGQLFLAMEYVETVSLTQKINSLPWSQKLRIATGVTCYMLDGLDYAHQKNFVHRDIKPGNVLAYLNGRKVGVKLSDFGLGKNYVESVSGGLTEDGQIRGSLHFMPPEQIHDCRNVDPRCDIYSTSATLYYLLTGFTPLQQSRADRVDVSRIINGNPIPIREHQQEIPAGLENVIHRALHRDPRKRFASAAHFHRALVPFTRKLVKA